MNREELKIKLQSVIRKDMVILDVHYYQVDNSSLIIVVQQINYNKLPSAIYAGIYKTTQEAIRELSEYPEQEKLDMG